MSINQEERACRAWPILVNLASQGSTITYGALGQSLGIHHRAVRYVLHHIQQYCLNEKLPPLTILVVDRSGKLGDGFIAYDVDKAEQGQQFVYDYNWSVVENPFSFASDGTTLEKLIKVVATRPDKSQEVYQRVRGRGYSQEIFRRALLSAYGRCAITGLTIQDGLEACHIIPWSESNSKQRLDVRNGVLINRFHHALFDKGLMTITHDYTILFNDNVLKRRKNSDFDEQMIMRIHGRELMLPKDQRLFPKEKYIDQHNKKLDWVMT